MADLGNVLDQIFKPEWLAVVHGVEALAANAEGDLKTQIQALQGEASTALNNAATQVQAAQGKVQSTLDPLVNKAIEAGAAALTAAYPPFGPLVAAAEGEVEKLADGGTDAIALALINKIAALLSQSAKSVAAVNLSNLAGAS